MLSHGLRATVTCVDTNRLDASVAGMRYDAAFVASLPPDVDPCGENGEFHTFCEDAPGFTRPVPVRPGATVTDGAFARIDLLPDR